MWYFTWILGLLLACALGIINVMRLEAQEVLAKEHVSVDPLTGLLDSSAFLARLREKIENSRRNGLPFSLLCLSLSAFRKQHSEVSNAEMDQILNNVAACFDEHIREVDIAARYDNDSFMIALPGACTKNAEKTASQVLQEIAASVKTSAAAPVNVSYAIAEYPKHIVDNGGSKKDVFEDAKALLGLVICKA